jgi:hypothetical protein
LSATLLGCIATDDTSDLLGPSAQSPGGGGGGGGGGDGEAAPGPDAPTETGGSSGTDGAGGRPLCLFTGGKLAPDDTLTTLGTLAETRDALETALSAAGPVAITWGEEIGGATELSLELIQWDERGKLDTYPSSRCILMSGEFHVATADGLIDANISGGFTHDGFEAYVALDADSCAPVAQLCERLGGGPYRGLALKLARTGISLTIHGSARLSAAGGAGFSVPGVELVSGLENESDAPIPPSYASPPHAEPTEPAPAECTTLRPGGAPVLTVFKAGAPPDSGYGGTIVDGIYDLTARTIYQSSPTQEQFFARASIRISVQGTHVEVVKEGSSGEIYPLIASLAPAGAALNPTTLCPDEGRSFGPNYTATPGHFTLVNGLYVEEFALRAEP